MEKNTRKKNTAAIFLAHLNPLTLSHEQIIRNLLQDYRVYVYPVQFLKNKREINTRSFPFSFEIRKQMVLESFDHHEDVCVMDDYAFLSPYIQYFPPFISPSFKKLKNNIVSNILEHDFITYTGDKYERILLKIFGFRPVKANRQVISSTNVKNLLYKEAISSSNATALSSKSEIPSVNWNSFVSPKVDEIIKKNWHIVEHFSNSADETIRILGMKFPKYGFI